MQTVHSPTRMQRYFAEHGWQLNAQRAVLHATPPVEDEFGVAPLSAHLPLGRLAWQNSRSVPTVQDGWPGALELGSGALGAPTELCGVGTPRLGTTLWRGASSDGVEVQLSPQAVAVFQELEQIRRDRAGAVRRAAQLEMREKELHDVLVHGQGLNGAPVSRESAVLGHADCEIGGTKLQEGAQTAAVLAHAVERFENGPTGPSFSQDPAVLEHADHEISGAKLQEGPQTAAVLVHVDCQSDKGPTGPIFWHNPAVHAGVDRQIGAAKPQEGGPMADVHAHAGCQPEKGPTGPMISPTPAVLGHADSEILGTKVQEGCLRHPGDEDRVAQATSVLAHADGHFENGPAGPMISQSPAVLGHADSEIFQG